MQLFKSGPCTLLDGAACLVLSSRHLTSVCSLRLGQSYSFKWPLSATRIFQKCIETVHPGKCDFTVSKTLDMVIKRLNMCCLFFWQQWFFFYCTFEAGQNEVSTGFSEWFGFDFHLEDYCFLTDNKKKKRPTNPIGSLGFCQQHTQALDTLALELVWNTHPGKTASSGKTGCFGLSLCWPVKLSDKECCLIAGLRQLKSALLSASAAFLAPKSSLPTQQGQLEELDPARCWCSQIKEAPSWAAPRDRRALGQGDGWDRHFDSNMELWNHVFRFAGN